MKKCILAGLIVLTGMISGCGAGLARNMEPLSGKETVGVMVPRFQVSMASGFSAFPLDEEVQDKAREVFSHDIIQQLAQKGIVAKVVTPSDRVAEVAKKYLELPRWGHHLSSPAEIKLGDLSDIFKENNIDRLLILGGVAELVQTSASKNATAAALGVTTSIIFSSVVPISTAKSMSVTLVSEPKQDGTLAFYNLQSFGRKGNFLDQDQRGEMARTTVEGWLSEVPKKM